MKLLENKIEKIIEMIKKEKLGDISLNSSFKDLTTIKIGGKIKLLYFPNNISSLIKIFKEIIKLKIPYFIIGRGSNLLVNDNYFLGIVISLKNINTYKIINENTIMIECGAFSYKIIKELTKNKIGNLETFGTIPATIGGLIYNNAGTAIKEIKDVIIKVDYLDIDGKIKTINKEDMMLDYRTSIFKEKKGIILRGYFIINNQGDYNKLKEEFKNKSLNQPINKNTFGSTFKNLPSIKAWEIIKKLDLENNYFNDVQISKKHYNFLINKGNATYDDMYNLIKTIKTKAIEKFNYELELEIEIINDYENLKDKSLRKK